MRAGRSRWIGAVAFGLVLCDLALAAWLARAPSPAPLRFSRETTYILGPRDRAGLPDYRAYLRAQQLGPHPSSSNALLDLYAALGADLFDADARTRTTRELGLRADERGELIWSEAYARATCVGDHERCARLLDAALADCGALSGEGPELVAGWLAANGAALAALHRASERPVLYVPIDEWGRASVALTSVLRVQRLLHCRAALRSARGEHAAAVDDVVAAWRLGALLSRDQDILFTTIGIGALELTARVARALAASPTLPASAAERLLRALPVVDERATLLGIIARARIQALAMAQSMVRARRVQDEGPLPSWLRRPPVLDHGAVLRRVNEGFDLLERAAREPARARRVAAVARVEQALRARTQLRPSRFDAVTCRLAVLRGRCTFDRFLADGAAIAKAIGIGTPARKLEAKIASIEQTRRALLAASGRAQRPRP